MIVRNRATQCVEGRGGMGLFGGEEIAKKVAKGLGVQFGEVRNWAVFKTPTSSAFHKSALLITTSQIIYGHKRAQLRGAHAVVDTSGNTAIAQGWVVKERGDSRKLFLTIESDNNIVIQLVPDAEATARKVAAYINAHAGQRVAPTPPPAPKVEPDIPEQIRKLAELRDQGILTNNEFDAKKAELLARM
jgi:hypothetical protein